MKYEPAYLLALATWPVTVCATNAQADSLRIARPAAFPAVSRHQTLDSLKAEVKLQLEQRYGQHYGCSALSLTSIAATLGSPLSEQQLRSMSEAFSGGIGHKFGEGICGALTGAIAQKVIEVLYREGDIHTSTIAPWQQLTEEKK